MTKFMKHINRKSILATLMVLFTLTISGLSGFASKGSINELDEMIQAYVEDYNISGIAVVVTQGDEVIYEGAYGSQQSSSPLGVHDTTYIASISKSMTATGIMMLVEEGVIDEESRDALLYYPAGDDDDGTGDNSQSSAGKVDKKTK